MLLSSPIADKSFVAKATSILNKAVPMSSMKKITLCPS